MDTALPLHNRFSAAAVLLKLARAMPRGCGGEAEILKSLVDLQSLVLRLGALLPSHSADGLGEAQRGVVCRALQTLRPVVRHALMQPLEGASPPVLDLLLELGRGSEAAERERSFSSCGTWNSSLFHIHSFVEKQGLDGPDDLPKEIADALARTELGYDVLLEGLRSWKSLEADEFYDALDTGLDMVTWSLVAWAVPLLFDGLRLRRGVEIASACGEPTPGQRRPFGVDLAAIEVLGDGETLIDVHRVLCGVQFFISAGLYGVQVYFGCKENDTDRVEDEDEDEDEDEGEGEGEDEEKTSALEALKNLETKITARVKGSGDSGATRSPGGLLRLVLCHIVDFVEEAAEDTGTFLALKLAFAVPCLKPKNLKPLHGYCGGLLSVWDACNHLLRLHAALHQTALPVQVLLAAVFGGVVGGLTTPGITGPFCVAAPQVLRGIARLRTMWSFKREGLHRCRNSTWKRRTGKRVALTALLSEAKQHKVLKPDPRTSTLFNPTFEAALSMRSVLEVFLRAPGTMSSLPADGVVPLKRLYFFALHQEPWMTTVLNPGNEEGPWREILGGASLSHGWLFPFTRRGLAESLEHDWVEKNDMVPGEAVRLLAGRAQLFVSKAVQTIDNVATQQGPPYVQRVASLLNAWANAVYGTAECNPLWESCVMHFCSNKHAKKRGRSLAISLSSDGKIRGVEE